MDGRLIRQMKLSRMELDAAAKDCADKKNANLTFDFVTKSVKCWEACDSVARDAALQLGGDQRTLKLVGRYFDLSRESLKLADKLEEYCQTVLGSVRPLTDAIERGGGVGQLKVAVEKAERTLQGASDTDLSSLASQLIERYDELTRQLEDRTAELEQQGGAQAWRRLRNWLWAAAGTGAFVCLLVSAIVLLPGVVPAALAGAVIGPATTTAFAGLKFVWEEGFEASHLYRLGLAWGKVAETSVKTHKAARIQVEELFDLQQMLVSVQRELGEFGALIKDATGASSSTRAEEDNVPVSTRVSLKAKGDEVVEATVKLKRATVEFKETVFRNRRAVMIVLDMKPLFCSCCLIL